MAVKNDVDFTDMIVASKVLESLFGVKEGHCKEGFARQISLLEFGKGVYHSTQGN